LPGITLWYDSSRSSSNIKYEYDRFLKALESSFHNENYKQEILLREPHYLLASSRYSEYPIKIFEDISDFWICIEGKIYCKDDFVIKDELENLLNYVFTTYSFNATEDKSCPPKPAENNEKLVNWLLKTDGEFILYALNKKTKDFAIMNDALGRLPFYYHNNGHLGLIISRELQFTSQFIQSANDSKFDRMAIAQYLLFGYPLGKRTLLANVSRVQPGSLLRICDSNKQFNIDSLHPFNFDSRKNAGHDIKKDAATLVSLFSEACKCRANVNENKKKNIVSLSGGLDSRCVILAINNNNIPCSAVTYVTRGWTPVLGSRSEVQVAEQLANMLGIEWQNYDFIEPKARDLLNLLTIKQGSTYLGYGSVIPFLEKLKVTHHGFDVTFFTGAGRETVIPDYLHSKKYKNLDQLVSHIIERRGNFPLSDIAAITQIKENELIDEIKNTLSTYPEKNLNRKYFHFLTYETAFKGIFEIEDKDRYYFWGVSPFYSIPFFDYAVSCDSISKPNQALYREILFQLSPLAASIDKADYGSAISSYKYKFMFFILTFTYKHHFIKKMLSKITNKKRSYKGDSKVVNCFRDQIQNCGYIDTYLSLTELRRIVNNSGKYSRRAIDFLFTVTSLIENTYGKDSISKFYG
jgi:asparagine synthase (glutamine-hydrolysing)